MLSSPHKINAIKYIFHLSDWQVTKRVLIFCEGQGCADMGAYIQLMEL